MGTAVRIRDGDATILLTGDLAKRMEERVRRAGVGIVERVEGQAPDSAARAWRATDAEAPAGQVPPLRRRPAP